MERTIILGRTGGSAEETIAIRSVDNSLRYGKIVASVHVNVRLTWLRRYGWITVHMAGLLSKRGLANMLQEGNKGMFVS